MGTVEASWQLGLSDDLQRKHDLLRCQCRPTEDMALRSPQPRCEDLTPTTEAGDDAQPTGKTRTDSASGRTARLPQHALQAIEQGVFAAGLCPELLPHAALSLVHTLARR